VLGISGSYTLGIFNFRFGLIDRAALHHPADDTSLGQVFKSH